MKVKNGMSDLPEGERPAKAQNINGHLDGNPNFTAPNPPLVLVQTHIDDANGKFMAAVAATRAVRRA